MNMREGAARHFRFEAFDLNKEDKNRLRLGGSLLVLLRVKMTKTPANPAFRRQTNRPPPVHRPQYHCLTKGRKDEKWQAFICQSQATLDKGITGSLHKWTDLCTRYGVNCWTGVFQRCVIKLHNIQCKIAILVHNNSIHGKEKQPWNVVQSVIRLFL